MNDAAQPPSKPRTERAADPEIEWFRTVYRGDLPQFTLRSFVVGSFLGAFMAGSNLYVGLKTGWGLGVAITSCILSFALGSALMHLRNARQPLRSVCYALFVLVPAGLVGFLAPSLLGIGAALLLGAAAIWFVHRHFETNLSVLENNSMQSTASSAGYSTGGTMVSAQAALLLVQGHHIPWYLLMAWTFFLAVLGTVMAIPMKRQMINIEQLKFPSGIAAAETLRSLYSHGAEAAQKARGLFIALGVGSAIAWLRDAHLTLPHPEAAPLAKRALAWLTKASVIPSLIEIPKLTLRGLPLARWTIGFEGSLILVAAGAFMGLRTTISMLGASLINYAVVAPLAYDHGAIAKELGFRNIVSFSLWPGAAIMVSSGLLSFGLEWRTVLRAFSGLGKLFGAHPSTGSSALEQTRAELDAIEVPSAWFLGSVLFATLGLVAVGVLAFDIRWWLGIVAVLLAFVLAIVACRATGETDTTPVGAMGKITQLTYGILAPANVVTNLMTASITAGAAGSAADLLTDLKSGYLLGAHPRRQFLAQLSGTVVGTLAVVPLFYWLVPTPDVVGSDRFPAPAAQVWKGVALVLANGIHSLHPWARWGMLIGALIGVVLPLLERALPRHRVWVPSAMGIGLALVIPCFNSISMFLGALLAWIFARLQREAAERYTIPCASGIIAGESLLGVAIALLAVAGYLD